MSPRSKQQNEVIRQKSIEAIREAALELFARNGYHSTSISQIAAGAGVSKGLLYNYFESKEALLRDIIMEVVALGDTFMSRIRAATDDGAEQIRMLVEASFSAVQQNRHYWKLMAALSLQTDALSGLMPMLKEKQEENLRAIAEMFRKTGAARARETAYYFSAVLDGVLLHYMQLGGNYPIEEMKSLVLERFLPEC